jgi:hypothetical protein
VALRPHWSLERMAAHHEDLERLEKAGPEALRAHLDERRETVLRARNRW